MFKIDPVTKIGKKTLIIIDDAMALSQTKINNLFVYSRTYGMNVIYLIQDFFGSSKQSIRSNTNVILLFRVSNEDLLKIYGKMNDGTFVTYDKFHKFCEQCWNDKPNAVLMVTVRVGPTKFYNAK